MLQIDNFQVVYSRRGTISTDISIFMIFFFNFSSGSGENRENKAIKLTKLAGVPSKFETFLSELGQFFISAHRRVFDLRELLIIPY